MVLNAKVLSVQEEGLLFKRFPFKEVCEHFKIKDALIPSKATEKEIECMGRIFSIENFCYEKFSTDLKYTRARFNITNTEVNCHFATTSIVEIQCIDEHQVLCSKPDQSCKTIIKKSFASSHEFSKAMLLEIHPPVLKCFYNTTENIPLNSPL